MMLTSPLRAVFLGLLTASVNVVARSPVYLFADDAAVTHETPVVSMDTFSVILSHVTEQTYNHPVMHWQEGYKNEMIENARAVWSKLDGCRSNNVFERNLDANLFVVIAGAHDGNAILAPHEPVFYVSNDHPQDYVALAEDTAILAQETGGHVSNIGALPLDTPVDFASFKLEYPGYEADVFDIENPADASFIAQVEHIRRAFETTRQTDGFDFVTLEITALDALSKAHGEHSEQYRVAQEILHQLLTETIIPTFQQRYSPGRSTVTVVLTPPPSTLLKKRAEPLETAQKDTCYASLDACDQDTDSCSGRGVCKAVTDDCFSCVCKSATFVGPACEYVDAVSDFQLLFWTGVGLIVVTFGVLLFVYKSGDTGSSGIIMTPQPLPKQD